MEQAVWRIPPGPTCPAETFPHIWQVALDLPVAVVKRLVNELSTDERQRATRFHFERDRRRYTVAHAALRQVLSRYLGCPPAAIEFTAGQRGKPALASGSDLRFNLAHSGEIAVIAVTCGSEIGVDVEQIHPLDDLLLLAERNFSPRENAALRALSAEQHIPTFFDIWTRKEAFIKALGEGLYYPLDAFDVSIGQPARLEAIQGQPPTGWQLHAFAPAPGYAGAVVAQGVAAELQFYHWANIAPIPYPLSPSEDRT